MIYQIYPRSFKDSTGSGIGDLNGITEKLEYLRWLGIRVIWLSPVYPSPMKDFGYDVSDYRSIDPIFGSVDDFKLLLKHVHEHGMYLIMDFVPNHTSDQHEWFLRSKQRQKPFDDFYVWKNGTVNQESQELEPPNNWRSCFGGPAWSFCPERRQFYLHQFLREQPDLNFRNLEVRMEMENILTYWMDLGVDGFRVDATSHLIEHKDFLNNIYRSSKTKGDADDTRSKSSEAEVEQNYYSGVTDAEKDGGQNHKEGAEDMLYHIDQPETYELIREWVQLVRKYGKAHNKHILLMTESYSPISEMQKYYRAGVDFPFNFRLCMDWKRDNSSASLLKNLIKGWMDSLAPGDWPNWVLSNHDRQRLATRMGSHDFVTAANLVLLTLPGTPTCYYGDEIGLENVEVSFDQCQDPYGKKHGPNQYSKFSRDPGRSPMPWNGKLPNAGFTECQKPWLPLNSDWKSRNVDTQKLNSNSILSLFKRLLNFHQSEPVFQEEKNLKFLPNDEKDNVLAFFRFSNDFAENFLVVVNVNFRAPLGAEISEVVFSQKVGEVVFSTENFGDELSYRVGSKVQLSFRLGSGQGLVVRFTGDLDEPSRKKLRID